MKTALLVIDVQNEYFTGRRVVSYPPESLSKVQSVMDAALKHEIPIALVRHASLNPQSPAFQKGQHGWELIKEIEAKPHDLIIDKNYPDSFTRTTLDDWLKTMKIEKIVICGYMTHMCCDTTARQAFHRGYKVEFLSDATGTLDLTNEYGTVTAEELHKAILVVQQSMFSRVLSSADWIAELESNPS